MDFGISKQLNANMMMHSQFVFDQKMRADQANEIAIASTADEAVEILKTVFADFENSLNPDEEIGLALTSFGAVRQIIVNRVIALSPALLQISGFENDVPVSLVQHHSQLNFLLIPVKKATPEAPRRLIGFRSYVEDEE